MCGFYEASRGLLVNYCCHHQSSPLFIILPAGADDIFISEMLEEVPSPGKLELGMEAVSAVLI